jgi:hypothetical protein
MALGDELGSDEALASETADRALAAKGVAPGTILGTALAVFKGLADAVTTALQLLAAG